MSGLADRELGILTNILKKMSAVESGVLFGSRALGTHKYNSDVDIALYGKGLVYSDILRIKSEIEETTLPYFFDLVAVFMIENENLIKHIETHGKVIYQRNIANHTKSFD